MLSHQKAVGGQDKLRRGMAPHLPEVEGWDDFHFATQLNQARALICGIGHYRSHWPQCAGTIVWQLNDCWPVTSWAAVDGDRRRKLLWYALRDLYAPVLLTVQPRADGPVLSLGNDTDETLRGTLALRRQGHDGTVLARAQLAVEVAPRGAVALPVPAQLAAPGDGTCEVLVAELVGTATRTVHPFAEGRDSALAAAAPRARARRVEGGGEVSVRGSSRGRGLRLLAAKVDADAVVERQLVALLAGESARFHGRSSSSVDAEAFLADDVLLSANDLVARARERAEGRRAA